MNNVVNFKMILEINQLLNENNIEYSIHGVGGCTCCGLELRQEGKSYPTDKILEVINGYLKNNTENELITFNEKGIKNKEKISFVFDGVKYSIKINDNDILLVRDGNDFINSFSFNEKHGKSNYYLKEHGYSVDMDINMKMFDVNDNKIYIKYVIADTECEYELLIEMGDIL